jgi:hypothetical protein
MPIQSVLPCAHGGFIENGTQQIEAKETNSPEAHHPCKGEQHTDDGIPAPARLSKQLFDTAKMLTAVFRLSATPGFRLFQLSKDWNAE